MKTIAALLLFATFLASEVFGQSENETILKANEFVKNKKYESAFALLESYDPRNDRPDILLLKEDIALNYFVTSLMHEFFAFKDLEIKEDVMDYRGKEGNYNMHALSIDSSILKLISHFPENYKLYKGLGDFYYDAQIRYKGQWLIDDSILSDLIEKNYKIAIAHNVDDYETEYKFGLIILTKNQYKESIPYFVKSIELKNDFADSHYNLAYAYLFSDDNENALKHALSSIELYDSKEYKGDAARMTGQIYAERKDDINAIKYYEMADSIDPANYYNLKLLLKVYGENANPKFQMVLESFFDLAPENPTIYNDLDEILFSCNRSKELIAFYKDKLSKYNDNKKILGNLNFYLGGLYLDTDKKVARGFLLEAKQHFLAIFDKDNSVFQIIEEKIKETE